MILLVVPTVICFVEYLVPIIIKNITFRLYGRTKHDTDIWNDLNNLKQEMAGISMIDEFSKYAKLQRKYIKLKEDLRNKVNERLSSRKTLQMSITYVFRVIYGIFVLVLLYTYNNEPVIIFPKGMLWPIHNFLSWPGYHEDSISLIMWFMIARLVVSTCKKVDAS